MSSKSGTAETGVRMPFVIPAELVSHTLFLFFVGKGVFGRPLNDHLCWGTTMAVS
jgi:hypothetical protein